MPFNFTLEGKPYLIIPSVPTPNGELHIGHIGGPYLRADMLARHLRQWGNKAYVACGTDSYESYVTWQAFKEQQEQTALCTRYHAAIARNLSQMNIAVDLFINPLAEQWQMAYQNKCQQIFDELQHKQALTRHNEKIFWDDDLEAYCTGCWLMGQCPQCAVDIAGYFCEICGAHFRPEQVINPKPRTPYQKLTEKTVSHWFMQIPKELPTQQNGINPAIREIYAKFWDAQQGRMRMTSSIDWGVKLQISGDEPQTFFNYGFMFSYFLLMGEQIAARLGYETNVFAANSPFITVNSFGIDNTAPFFASIYGTTSHLPQFKPFDAYLINYFYYLNGRKISTSRRHVIWVNDAIEKARLSSDLIRFYLASLSANEAPGDFKLQEFQHFYNKLAAILQTKLQPLLNELAGQTITAHDADLIEQLGNRLEIQAKAFSIQNYQPHEAVAPVQEWLALPVELTNHSAVYTWLKGWAMLAYPFMPTLASQIWQTLTGLAEPKLADFLITAPTVKAFDASILPVAITDNELALLYSEFKPVEV